MRQIDVLAHRLESLPISKLSPSCVVLLPRSASHQAESEGPLGSITDLSPIAIFPAARLDRGIVNGDICLAKMPATDVVFYREDDTPGAEVPALDWLVQLSKTNTKAFVKCRQRIELLRASGHELRRPFADMLRDEIYELRIRLGTVNYRLLYFFNGRIAAVIACGLTKESGVPSVEIDRAIERKKKLLKNPAKHTHREP